MFSGLADALAKALVLLALAAAGAYLAWEHLTGAPDPVDRLRAANPGWTIEQPRHAGLRLVDGSGAEVFINSDDATGPLRLQRLDCTRLAAAFPPWLRLPPGRTGACLQIGDGVQVLNRHTAVPVGELWSRHYEPHLDELQLAHSGGQSSGGKRGGQSMSYSVDPAPGSTGPQVNLMAFHLASETVLVVTLRPAPPAEPPR